MAELLLELYSEEIPPQLQIGARNQLKQFFERSFEEEDINYKELLLIEYCTCRTSTYKRWSFGRLLNTHKRYR